MLSAIVNSPAFPIALVMVVAYLVTAAAALTVRHFLEEANND